MPTIDLTDAEHAEVAALIRRAIEENHFPLARRLDLLRSALAKLDPAAAAALRRPYTREGRPLTGKNAKPGIQKRTTPKGR